MLRTLLRAPGFAATAIGTIALAISLASVVFAVADGVLFKPLPFPDAERLFVVQGRAQDGTAALAPLDVDYLREADIRVTVASFAAAAALRHAEHPEVEFSSFAVDRHFFDVLGQRPLFGGFAGDDFHVAEAAGAPRAAVVTYAFWRDQLSGDAAAVGRPLDFVEAPLFVAGVLPRDFVFPHSSARFRPDILVPLTASSSTMRWSRSLSAIARFDAGISFEEGRAKLDAVLEARGEYHVLPRQNIPGPYVGVELTPLSTVLGRAERPVFRAAFAGAALLILLGCINVAGLLVARTRDRERELTVRAALGATRTQLLRLVLLESLLIGLAGACAGLFVAQPLLAAALAQLPDRVLLLKPPEMDARVIAFAVVAATITLTTVSALSVLIAASGPGLRFGWIGDDDPRALVAPCVDPRKRERHRDHAHDRGFIGCDKLRRVARVRSRFRPRAARADRRTSGRGGCSGATNRTEHERVRTAPARRQMFRPSPWWAHRCSRTPCSARCSCRHRAARRLTSGSTTFQSLVTSSE